MMVVVLLGILSLTANIGFQDVRRHWQRQSLNSVVRDLAYWLDLVRNKGAQGTVCRVTINAPATLTAGSTLATVNPSNCAPAFQLDAASLAQIGSLTISTSPAGGATITFDTGGGASFQGATQVGGVEGVEIGLGSASADLRRCLALSDGTGAMRVGGSASSGGTCRYDTPF